MYLFWSWSVCAHEKNIINLHDQIPRPNQNCKEREREGDEKEMTSEEAHHLVSNNVNGRQSPPCVYEIINIKHVDQWRQSAYVLKLARTEPT